MRILGLDASTKVYGWAVYDTETQSITASGSFPLKGTKLEVKLNSIYDEIRMLFSEYYPDYTVIEGLFLKNVSTIETLSEARGVTRLAIYPETLYKIATATVKSNIGLTKALQDPSVKAELSGFKQTLKVSQYKDKMRAIKKQLVMDLVNKKFNLSITCDDESDACAIAYAFSLTLK